MVFHSTKQQKMIFWEHNFSFYQTAENVGGKLFSLENHFPCKMILQENNFHPYQTHPKCYIFIKNYFTPTRKANVQLQIILTDHHLVLCT